MQIITTIILAAYVLFLPGFVLSFVFFSKKQIEVIERIALSFALSIALVPLLGFYLNLIGVKINSLSVAMEVLLIIILGLLLLLIKKLRHHRHHEA